MTVLRRFAYDRRRSMTWWVVGMAALVAFTIAFYPSIEGQEDFDELVQDLPASLQALMGVQDGISLSSAPGYLWARLFSTLGPLLLLVFAISAGSQAIGGSEEDGSLEMLLSNPTTRLRVFVERYVAAVLLLLALSLALAGTLLLLAPLVNALDGVSVSGLLAGCGGAFGLALLHGTVAFGVGAALGRRGPAIAVPTALAVAGYLAYGLLTAADAPATLRSLTPWHWYLDQNMLVEGPRLRALLLPAALSAPILPIAAILFLRRDLH